jgi:hypothetical protein
MRGALIGPQLRIRRPVIRDRTDPMDDGDMRVLCDGTASPGRLDVAGGATSDRVETHTMPHTPDDTHDATTAARCASTVFEEQPACNMLTTRYLASTRGIDFRASRYISTTRRHA